MCKRQAGIVMAGRDPAIQEKPRELLCLHPREQTKRNLVYRVTNDLARRVFEHKQGKGSLFTQKYRVSILVHAEELETPQDAIQRETNLKKWPRKWKLDLIEKSNPDWIDLYEMLV